MCLSEYDRPFISEWDILFLRNLTHNNKDDWHQSESRKNVNEVLFYLQIQTVHILEKVYRERYLDYL